MMVSEKQWDKLLHIKTMGRDDTKSTRFYYPYEPTPYTVLERLANFGYITKQNHLLDYGCGKGRVDFFLSYQTRCHATGIEFDKRIYEKAQENKKTAVSAGRVLIKNVCAEQYEVPDEVDRCYFFNPFSAEILKKVLEKVKNSYYQCPREILLFFYYPSMEYKNCLLDDEMIQMVEEISCQDLFEKEDERECILVCRV